MLARNQLWLSFNEFKQGKYDSSIENALSARAHFLSKSEFLLESWANVILGLSYTIKGNDEESIRFIGLVDSFCAAGGLERLKHYNLISVMFRRKCKGYNYSNILTKVQQYAESKNADDIKALIQLLEGFNCPKSN